MLKAIGKFIDTMPIQQLLSQEEARADSVTIEVDRFYGTHDLKDFIFMMRGISESGGEAEAFLIKEIRERTIRLTWEIGPAFTKEAGTLALDLFAYRYAEEDADPLTDPPDHLLRYQLPSVQVRGLPDGSHVLDEQSYTAFLLLVRETALQVISELTDAKGAVWEAINRIDGVNEFQKDAINSCITEIKRNRERIQSLEDGFVPIIILTESEYAQLSEKDAGTLYVVKADSD